MESILVYVIIGVIYFVAKAMNKNKEGNKPKGKPVNQPQSQQRQPQQRQPQQRQVEQKAPAPPKQPATFEDLLGELLGEQPKKQPVPPPVEVFDTDEFELVRQRQLEEERTRKQKERAAVEKRAKIQQEEVLRRKAMMAKLAVESHQDYKKAKNLSPKKIAKSFDLRQAIIAKTILDRPYID
ncbi:MAG: hypothetical protein R2728_09660 [Chitinophagales bacterium]